MTIHHDAHSPAMQKKFERFMRESNWIEGECEMLLYENTRDSSVIGKLYENDLRVMTLMYEKAGQNIDPCEDDLLRIHLMLCEEREKKLQWQGEYRQCPVQIGDRLLIDWKKIKKQMAVYFLDWNTMNAWQAHCEYEMIHPFEDLNGRTGRILWAWKMIQMKRDPFGIPFLQHFYYSTLTNYQTNL